MKPKFAGLCLAAALFALAWWLVVRPALTPRPAASPIAREEPATAARSPSSEGVVKAPLPAPPSLAATPSAAATSAATTAALSNASSSTPPETDLPTADTGGRPAVRDPQIEAGKVRGMVHDFHTLMGENPVGTNAEIMQAMRGGNPRQAQLGPPEGMNLNGQGELVDQWNTPYFFHQLSRDVMEVHSAGPDRVFGTKDDMVVR